MNTNIRIAIPACIVVLVFGMAFGGSTLEPTQGPKLTFPAGEMPEGRGFIPPPMDLSYLDGSQAAERFSTVVAPERWDWREQGVVTTVKNQSVCGACYAFASLADIESKLLIDGAGTYDFSENNAKECNWYGSSCSGGSYYTTASFFSKYGTVLETCDPYVAGDVGCNSGCAYIKTLLDWRVISGNAVPADSILKNYIYDNGPVYTTLYTGDAGDLTWQNEFDNYDGSYVLRYTGSSEPNHAVLIVGWDDTLSHAGGQGAWIVKNSWGTAWGGVCRYGAEGGYFMIAYGSASIGKWSSYIDSWQDYDSQGEVIFYDEGGWTNTWGYGPSNTTCWALSKFVPTSETNLNRVEFWTNDATTDIDIYVYDDFNGSAVSTLLTSQLNSSFSEAGYHSVALSSPVSLITGDAIYVVMKLTNASAGYPIVADNQGSFETATTFISIDGSSGSWYDLGVNQSNDAAIRIRTSTYVGIENDLVELPIENLVLRNYPNPFNASTTIEYGLPFSSHISLVVYDILGRQIEILASGYHDAGFYQAIWNPVSAPSGYYFYKIQAGSAVEMGKMLLLK